MQHFNLPLVFLILLTACTAQAQEPASADHFSQRGIDRFEKNDLDGAIADFTKAIELNGKQLEFCLYFRGIALYRRGRLDEAIADLSKAISLKQHPRFYDDRGNLLAQKGDFDGAIADLNKAVELEPKYAKAYGDRGIVQLMRDEDTAAESDFKKCFELDKTLEPQFKSAANKIKQQAVFRTEHKPPADVEILKFDWTETASRVLNVPSSPSVPVSTTPVSSTGLRVIGGSEKGEPGPPLPSSGPAPDPFDPLSPGRPSRSSSTRVRGFEHKFMASIKNTGTKTITNVQWAYFFDPVEESERLAYVFSTKVEIRPGKEAKLRDQVPVVTSAPSKAPTPHNRAQFKERVVILRLDYADGSSWKSSGTANRPER